MTVGAPEKLTLQLKANGVLKEKVEISAMTDWSYTWSGLPKYENGVQIQYTIENDETFTGYVTASKTTGSVTLMINTKGSQSSMPGTGTGSFPQGGTTGGMTGGMTGGTTGGFTGGITGNLSGFPSEEDIIIEEVERTYEFAETSVGTLSPNDVANIEIQIDELDINKIYLIICFLFIYSFLLVLILDLSKTLVSWPHLLIKLLDAMLAYILYLFFQSSFLSFL